MLLSIFLPLQADVLLDAVQSGGAGFQCGKVVGDEFFVVSDHVVERKAIARCMTEKVKDLEGEYEVRPVGVIRIVITPEAAAQLVHGVVSDSEYPVPPASEWIATEMGDGICTSFDDSSGTLTIVGAGIAEEGCFVHKTAPSGDLQFSAQIVSITESLTPDPVMSIALNKSASSTTAPNFRCFWHIGDAQVRCAYRETEGGTTTTGIFGTAGFALPASVALQCDESAESVIVWESDVEDPVDADDWTIIATIPIPDFCTGGLEAGFIARTLHASNTAEMVVDNAEISDTLTLVDQPDVGARVVNHLWDYETGEFQAVGGSHDSAFIQTLPEPQTGGAVITQSGGCGPDSDCDSKLVDSFTVPANGNGGGSEVVNPRNGDFFLAAMLWQATHKNSTNGYAVKPLSELAGDEEPPYDRKDYRDLSNGAVRNEWSNNTPANHVDFDREIYVGLSLYFPLNWEVETGSPNASSSARMLFQNGTDSSNHMVHIDVRSDPCCSGASESHLYLYYTTTSGAAATTVDLGDISDRLGKWTDIVYRARANNCASGTCNHGEFGTFSANQGIMQVWVSDATDDTLDGNGCYDTSMVVNRTSLPVGPRVIEADFRVQNKLYAFGWGNQNTEVYGPIFVGYDEISWGYADEGTDYTDVHPNRCAQP